MDKKRKDRDEKDLKNKKEEEEQKADNDKDDDENKKKQEKASGAKSKDGFSDGSKPKNQTDVSAENPRNSIQDVKEMSSSPYLKGDEIMNDSGPILSVFGLQEILAKVRETQTRLQMTHSEGVPTPPDMQDLFGSLRDFADFVPFKILNKPPVFYKHIAAQSDTKVFRVNTFIEEMSKIGSPTTEDDAKDLMGVVLDRLKFIIEQGSFLLHDIPTHYDQLSEIVSVEALGVDFDAAFKAFRRVDVHFIETQLKDMVVMNSNVLPSKTDHFRAAMPYQVYKIHDTLTNYVIQGQNAEFKHSMLWLQQYGEAKLMEFSPQYLTDIFYSDTMYTLNYSLPVNPSLIWDVPRSHTTNLMVNAALGVPSGTYILPNAKIASVTITSRIVTTAPFGQMNATTPTESQMHDVRKIYLALMFPNQILLDLREEPGHNVDVIAQQVSAIVGKILFSYGPTLFNITAKMARLLDLAAHRYFTMTGEHSKRLIRGASNEPFDFRVTGFQNAFDANQLRSDPTTGQGFNGFNVNDVQVRPGPYPHVRRRICYAGYDSEDILDERLTGDGHRYANFDAMIQCLEMTGRIQEANYLNQMMQHHIVRFAYLNQIINCDLLSAFSMPDDMFFAVAERLKYAQVMKFPPIILDVSYHSIFHAFKMRFLPTDRPEFLAIQPLIESVYASELSIMKLNAQKLRDFTVAHSDSFPTQKNSDIWRVVTDRAAEPIKTLMNVTGQQWYVNVRDMYQWIDTIGVQQSLSYLLNVTAWELADDPVNLMFTSNVFACRQPIPEPAVEDIEMFRREAKFYTNLLDALPRTRDLVRVTRQTALERAGEGRLKASVRSWLDSGKYVKFGDLIRPLYFSVHTSLPDRSILENLPFTYDPEKSSGPIAKYSLNLNGGVYAYLMLYTAEDHSTPDEFTNVNPSYTNSVVFLPEKPFLRVEVNTLLTIIDKELLAIRKRVRIQDLTKALVAGSKYALPQGD
uniref:Subcore-shell T2 protein n=1 Tax=Mudumu virus TaxID=2841875 RepID=A0A8E8R7I8_9REOV|nr:subcore-shell T2 protein [Mudumu virus]